VTVFDASACQSEPVEIESEVHMNWNGKRIIGRHVVDIDGCLRTTDLTNLGTADIAALHGALPADTSFVMELNGEIIPLEARDRVSLDEMRVVFFRSVWTRRHVSAPAYGAGHFAEPHALAA
jgi:hypothetical protein